MKFWKTLIDNCFIKAPKELAIEEVETNFGFMFLTKPEEGEKPKDKEAKSEEKKEAKSEEKLLSTLLHREAKIPADTPKHFNPKDLDPLVPIFIASLTTMIKFLDPKILQIKSVEKAEIVMLISKLVRVSNEEIHAFLIKNQIIDKSIVKY